MQKLLSDERWRIIEKMLPGKATDRGRTAADNRLFVEAVLWIARTGAPWRDLPQEFGLWNSVYQRFARWSKNGVWKRVFSELAQEASFRQVVHDSSIVRSDQHAAKVRKEAVRRPSADRASD